MSSSVPDYKRKDLEALKQARIEDHAAATRELVSTLSAVGQTKIKRLLSDLEREIQEIDKQLALVQIPEEAHGRVPVRVFCILSQFCTHEMVELLVLQNHHQPFFSIGIANEWKYWSGRSQSESTLQSFHTEHRVEFCDKFQEEMNRYNHQQVDPFPREGINLAITDLPFPQKKDPPTYFYAWNTLDRKGNVIGISDLEFQSLLQSDPDMARKIVVRVVQRLLLYSQQIPYLQLHTDIRGCLFDKTRLATIQRSVRAPGLCSSCEASIRKDKGPEFYRAVNDWLKNSFRPVTT